MTGGGGGGNGPHRWHLPSLLRRRLWRIVTSLSGGLTVTGSLPPTADGRGRVLVANHSSHADTAALMAALPTHAKPVFAAAADYWFDVWWRRLLVTGLAGALPVRRHESGAYAALLAAARPAVEDGRTVVVYPEGTRTLDGSVGRFASGATRLARDLDVDVVPVALRGTREVLPKNGRFTPTPLEVRIGAPVAPADADPDVLHDRVAASVAEGPARERVSRTWQVVARLVTSPWGLVVAFCWGLAEAVSWPVMAEMSLVLLAVAVPRRIPHFSLALVTGSVAGVLTTAAFAAGGTRFPAPWTTERMREAAARHLADGPAGILHQALDGIPVKVYARIAGENGFGLGELAGWTALERGARLAVIALVLWFLARLLHPWLRRLYGPYLVAVSLGFAVAISLVVHAWS
ncbi:MAG: lysophospholipid acyltransferase family protein [Aeromicrobium erythreum]